MQIDSGSGLTWSPAHPGDFVRRDILDAYGLSQQELANRLVTSRRTVNELVGGRRGISAEMAVKLSALTGRSAEFWHSLQAQYDLWNAREDLADLTKDLKPLSDVTKGSDPASSRFVQGTFLQENKLLESIILTVEGQKKNIEEAILELSDHNDIDELTTSIPAPLAEDRMLSRRPHGYVEIVEVVLSIVTSLGSAFVYDFLKSKGVKVKKDDADSEEKSELDDRDDPKS